MGATGIKLIEKRKSISELKFQYLLCYYIVHCHAVCFSESFVGLYLFQFLQ